MGEGWSIGRPIEKEITKSRLKLTRLTEELEAVKDKKDLFTSKKKKIIVNIDDGDDTKLADIPKHFPYEEALEALKIEAEKALNQGAVPFYGCSKCRWSRGGCIWWKCNPQKFKEHFEKYPEKYAGNKELLAIAEAKMKVSELKNGEFA